MISVRSESVVRDAIPRDVGAIREVAYAANEEFRAPMGEILFAGYLANVLDVESRAREADVLVVEDGSGIVGTITLYRDINDEGMPTAFPTGTAGIRATAVSPTARGQGIGSALVNAAIARAQSVGARAIALHTADCMEGAMRLYERHGFRRAPEHDFRANDFFGASAGASLDALAFVLDFDETR
jgi:ribosomal protein S18 acetylase RimI-like enzyme